MQTLGGGSSQSIRKKPLSHPRAGFDDRLGGGVRTPSKKYGGEGGPGDPHLDMGNGPVINPCPPGLTGVKKKKKEAWSKDRRKIAYNQGGVLDSKPSPMTYVHCWTGPVGGWGYFERFGAS